MRIPRIYHPHLHHSGGRVELSPQASQHVSKVLRLREQAPLILFDGRGHAWSARLCQSDKHGVQAELLEPIELDTESPLHIHLGLGISKGERMDYAIQKAVETGVSEITPLLTERTVVRLDTHRRESRQQHWQGVIISACEQCGRNRLPDLHAVTPLAEWVTTADTEQKLVFDGTGEVSLQAITPAPRTVNVLIGPEGGLHELEIEHAKQSGFKSVRLGPRVLRTETAAVASIATLQTLWGDFL